jgi:hypothetical protein
MEDPEPLWRRILLNELLLAGLAALLILYIAWRLATDSAPVDEKGRPVKAGKP